MNRHTAGELAQMQSLPLKYKIELTKQRIEAWYNSWTQFEIYDKDTGKTRYATIDTREYGAEPEMKPTEYINRENRGHVYMSFSGGKDSTVLKHIIDSMYEDVPAVFVNTGLEYPEIQKFAKSQKNVVVVRPDIRFDQVIKTYGYPVISKEVSHAVHYARKSGTKSADYYMKRFNGELMHDGAKSAYNMDKWRYLLDADFDISALCCSVMKKKPIKQYAKSTGRIGIIGTMCEESRLRKTKWLQFGCNAWESKEPVSKPISFWTNQDILHYIKEFDVPYCPVYGDIRLKPPKGTEEGQLNVIDYLGCYEPEDELETTGCDRTGCTFCMFGCHREKVPNRFQRLKETHPRQYEYCIGGGEYNEDGKWQPNKEGLGLGKVLDYIGVEYE